MTPNSVTIQVMNLAGTRSNAPFRMTRSAGASAHSSDQALVSIPIVFVISILSKLPTIYKGIPECQAESPIAKLQTLFIVSPFGLIQSDPKKTLWIFISDS